MLDQSTTDRIAGPVLPAEILGASSAAIYLTDARGRITYFNEAAAELWGLRPVLGESRWCGAWKLRFPDGRRMARSQSPMAIAIKEGRAHEGEAMAERPDGTLVSFLARSSPIHDHSGEIVGAMNILTDITPRKNAEEAIYRLAAIVESSDDAIISKTLCGIVTSWNLGAQRLFGYASEEAIGKHISFLIPVDRKDEEDMILNRIRHGERVDHFDTIRQRKDGTLVHISLTVSPVRNAAGVIIGASKIARDVSERKASESRIRMLMREVNHRVKNQFAVILSIVRETNKRAANSDEFEAQIRERIMALARSHDLLVDGEWQGATLHELVANQVQSFSDGDRVRVSGERIILTTAAVQYLGIAFHELATNAAKHGALSGPAGVVDIAWTISATTEPRLRLTWAEQVGPPVGEASRGGFGRVVLERVAPAAVNGVGHLGYQPEGIVWTLDAPLDAIAAPPGGVD
jgi:PAS domain S-box-containing protein